VAEIIAGLLPSYLAFALFCPLIGLATITLLNSANATLQVESDPELRGRVMAIYMTIVMGGTPIGAPVIGWIGETYGARWTLIVGGVLVLVGVALAMLVYRSSGLASFDHEQSGDRRQRPQQLDTRPVLQADGARLERRS